MFKKFGIGMLAVALAVAFSAFTSVKNANKKTHFTASYWYKVDPASQVILQGEAPLSQEEFDNAYCPSPGTIDCLRGFNAPINTQNGPVGGDGDEEVPRSNP